MASETATSIYPALGSSLGPARVTPRSQRTFALLTVAVLVVVGLGATPFANMPLVPVPGYMTAFGAAMIVINALLAVMLYSRGAIEHRSDATALGTAYLFVATILLPLIASFPGGLMARSMIGMPGTVVWLWLFWHGGFGLAIIRYARVAARPEQVHVSMPRSIWAVLAIVTALAIAAAMYMPILLPTLQNGRTLFTGATGIIPLTILGILGFATVQVARLRGRTPEQLWLTVAMVAACFDVWLTYKGSDRFSVGWYLSKCGSVLTSLTVLLSLMHQINLLYSRAAAANAVLEGLALRDALTGLINRRGLDEALAVEWRRSRREQQPLSVLMIDVDYFKRFNDRYGHPAGDECLRRVANALLTAMRRPADIVARYGGEEFTLLLPGTDSLGAVEMAMRARMAVRALGVPHADSPEGIVCVSIGLASAVAGQTGDAAALIAAADRGLYRAKSSGRDRCCWAEEPGLTSTPALLETVC